MRRLLDLVKKRIVVAADHRGRSLQAPVIDFLEGRGIEVVSLIDTDEKDSYARIVQRLCRAIETREADSGIMLEQFGCASSDIASSFFAICSTPLLSEHMAYEITRKLNPRIICVAAEDAEGMRRIPEEVIATVSMWLDTSFLQDIPPEDRPRYERREAESRRIHLGSIGSFMARNTQREAMLAPLSTVGREADLLIHYDRVFGTSTDLEDT